MTKTSKYQKLALVSGLFFTILGCTPEGQKGEELQEGSKVADAIEADKLRIVNLEQGWTLDTQQAFYFTDQGSRILPYKWFLVLEQASNEKLFRNDENINSYRYLPSKANSWNPDGLPVGFVKNTDTQNNQEWMGFTCAACHTGQIQYKDIEMRIEGGPTLADFEAFNEDLVAALSATYQEQAKFDRFSRKVLGFEATANQVSNLRQALLKQTEVLETRNLVNRPNDQQPRYGFSRLDAIGAIFNQILANFNGLPTEGRAADAPVSYPFLWGTHQSDVVQWPGFAPNGPASIGALIRNGGEVLGVYGQLNIPDNANIKHYSSSLDIPNLGELEKWVAELRSPAWPSEYLPPIDPVVAAKGQLHFEKHCVACHQIVDRADEGKMYKAVLTPLSDVGTDPTELTNMLQLRPAGKFAGRKEFVLAGPVIGEQTSGLEPLVNAVVGSLLEHPVESLKAALIEFEGGLIAGEANDGISANGDSSDNKALPQELINAISKFSEMYNHAKSKKAETNSESDSQTAPANPAVYKARPLNGIWATAPYLHNGSVPNLYELLQPAANRSKEFYLGSREYDPVNVGYDIQASSEYPNAFKLDTTLKGNSNSGHEYGTTELSEAEKLELLEYLKTL